MYAAIVAALLFPVSAAAFVVPSGAVAGTTVSRLALQTPDTASCTCAEDFDRLVEKIDANYAAMVLEYTGERRNEYDALRIRLRARAERTTSDECVHVMRELTDWFGDGHLFISEQPTVPEDAARRHASVTERVSRTERELRDYLARDSASLHAIEGVWYHRAGYRVAIVARRALGDGAAGGDDELVAVMLTDTIPNWSAGQVKATFTRRPDGRYAVRFRAGDHSPRTFAASLQKGLLLHMPPVTWGRELEAGEYERAMLAPHDPRAPTLSVRRDGSVVVSVPSHDPQYMPRLDSLVAAHRDALERAEVLVVDIRGNEGGSSGTTRALGPFVYTDSTRPPRGHQGVASVLSSEDNIRYFERASSQGWVAPGLLARMRANPGALVPFADDTTAVRPSYRPPFVATGPRNVAILMDGHTASAAEAMVLQAVQYTKVTTFGAPTSGTIDYQNVLLVPVGCASRGLMLGYPTIAASNRLPEGGFNRTGIRPDVALDKAAEAYPIAFIVGYFAGLSAPGR